MTEIIQIANRADAPKPELVVLRGLPRSGKTEYARTKLVPMGFKRLNRHALWSMVCFDDYTAENENIVMGLEVTLASKLLLMGYNVVIDDVNIHPYTLKMWWDVAEMIRFPTAVQSGERINGVTHPAVVLVDFMDVTVETCVRRDKTNKRKYGKGFIEDMHKTYLELQGDTMPEGCGYLIRSRE